MLLQSSVVVKEVPRFYSQDPEESPGCEQLSCCSISIFPVRVKWIQHWLSRDGVLGCCQGGSPRADLQPLQPFPVSVSYFTPQSLGVEDAGLFGHSLCSTAWWLEISLVHNIGAWGWVDGSPDQTSVLSISERYGPFNSEKRGYWMGGLRKNDPAISVLNYKLFLSTIGRKSPKPRQCHYLISNKRWAPVPCQNRKVIFIHCRLQTFEKEELSEGNVIQVPNMKRAYLDTWPPPSLSGAGLEAVAWK